MYKLLILDDESEVRERLSTLLDFKAFDFEVAELFDNGYELLDYLSELEDIDLVVTDIKMPYLDGLELVKILKAKFPLIKVIVITGYDEFDYAKTALENGVLSYIMKPVTKDELENALVKAHKTLDDERAAYKNALDLETFKKETNIYLRQATLNNIIKEKPTDYDLKTLKSLNITFKNSNFILLAFIPQATSDFSQYELNEYALKKIVDEVILKKFTGEVFLHNEKVVAILSTDFSSTPLKKELDLLLEEILTRTFKYYSFRTTIGVSSLGNSINDFRVLYHEATHALSYNKINENGFYYFSEMSKKFPLKPVDDSDFKKLRFAIRYESLEEAEKILSELKKKVQSTKYLNQINYFIGEISCSLIKCAENIGDIYKKYGDDIYDLLKSSESIDVMFETILKIIVSIKDYNESDLKTNFTTTMNRAFEYLEANYSNIDLDLNMLADKMNLSVSYLCSLFKKEKNTTFVKILTDIRIDKAKELLKAKDMKIIDISEAVGFVEPYYFSRIFRKVTGYSPKEYKKQ